jgi:hypothetical protein
MSDRQIRLTSADWARAHVRKAAEEVLAEHGLTPDSPRHLWPEGTIRRIRDRVRRGRPPSVA